MTDTSKQTFYGKSAGSHRMTAQKSCLYSRYSDKRTLSLLCNATTLTESILLQALLATSAKCKQYDLSILLLSSIVRNLQWLMIMVIVMADCVTVSSLKVEISAS